MAYYELFPKFTCDGAPCEPSDFCKDKRKYEIDYSNPSSLYNWVQQFNMVCSPKSDFGLFGGVFFAGFSIGSLVLPKLSDIYGRKPLVLLGMSLHLLTGIKMLFETN